MKKTLTITIEIADDSDGIVEARAALRQYGAALPFAGPGDNIDCAWQIGENRYTVNLRYENPNPLTTGAKS